MHNKYLFSNLIGTFIFNEHLSILDKKLFKDIEQYNNKEKTEKEFEKKYSNLKIPEGKELEKILTIFKDKTYFNDFYQKNIALTKQLVKGSVKDDLLTIQTVSNLNEIDKSVNILMKRLREWYALFNPELENSLQDQEKFVELVVNGKEKKLKDSMGADLQKQDLEPITNLAKELSQLYQLRKKQEAYLEILMKKVCPNLLAITGAVIGAKLLAQSGSLKHLSEFPASTIQLLGAEKALFRHMKTKARPPKYGFLHEHPLISKNKKQLHGKIARALADKISIAVKVDYFKGEFIGDKLLKQIEKRFK